MNRTYAYLCLCFYLFPPLIVQRYLSIFVGPRSLLAQQLTHSPFWHTCSPLILYHHTSLAVGILNPYPTSKIHEQHMLRLEE